jgi:aspartyl-tRNA(Asn)/glutamyl-tRNA(Gln) amidotransferase subunit A
LVAHASSFDTIGIMSKEIDNIRKTLSIISGKDRKDATSFDLKVDDYKPFDTISLPTSLGVIKEELLDELNLEIADRYRYLVSYLKSKNVKIKEIDLPFFKYSIPTYYVLTMAEASSNLSRFDGVRYGNRVDSADLSELYLKSRTEGFSDEVKRRIMTGTYVLSSGYYDAYFSKALKVRRLIKDGYSSLLSNCDNLLLPSTPDLPFKLNNRLNNPLKMYLADMFTVPMNLAGIPSLNIPVGFSSKKLPIGFQIVGNSFKEETLFSFARILEKEEIFDKI